MTTTPSVRLIVAGLVGLLALLAGGCTSSDSDPTPSPSVALATSVPSLNGYCEIQVLRQRIADGELDRSQLPDFADTTEVDGTPRILDFTTGGAESTAQFLDRLYASPGMEGVRVSYDDIRECMTQTTDADIEKTQGGPGYLAGASS